MSVHYTATWYDVTQARQQEHTPYTQTHTGPAGRSSGQWGGGGGGETAESRAQPASVYSQPPGAIGSKWRSSVL